MPASEPEAQKDVQPLVLTNAVLERYARGLVKETEIIRRPGRGTHYGVSVTGSVSGGESGEVLETAGMTARQYLEVRTLVASVWQATRWISCRRSRPMCCAGTWIDWCRSGATSSA